MNNVFSFASVLVPKLGGVLTWLPDYSWFVGCGVGFVVDIHWDGGKVQRVQLLSKLGNPCTVQYGGQRVAVTTEPGKTYTFDAQLRASN